MENLFFFKTYRAQGIDLTKNVKKFHFFIDSLVTSCLLLLMIYNFYTEMDFESLKSIVSVLLVIVKYLTTVRVKEDIVKLFKEINEFWNIDMDDDDLTFFRMYPVRLTQFYKIYMVIGPLMFSLRAFFATHPTIFGCYIPPQIPVPIFFLIESYLLWIFVMIYPSYNMLVCHLISNATVQFRLLNLKVQAIDLEGSSADGQNLDKCVEEIKHIITYHQRLIRFADEINDIFSTPMGCLIVLGIALLCTDMYILSLEQSSFVNLYRVMVTTTAIISEFFIVFGLPAQLMMDQAEDTANTIYYECKWFLPNLIPMRKLFIMMIMRSQRSVCITALDYHVINKETIVLMLKTAYSFFTFLQTVT